MIVIEDQDISGMKAFIQQAVDTKDPMIMEKVLRLQVMLLGDQGNPLVISEMSCLRESINRRFELLAAGEGPVTLAYDHEGVEVVEAPAYVQKHIFESECRFSPWVAKAMIQSLMRNGQTFTVKRKPTWRRV